MTRTSFLSPLATGILGITLMIPGYFFILTLLARLCFGVKSLYYYFAPSFLQTPFDLFAFHKAQCIIVSLLIAAACNTLTIQGQKSRHWLNAAVVLQSMLFLLLLTAYTVIQHIRY
jgi:hypothetical protein